jgi:RNase P subunit RPR2
MARAKDFFSDFELPNTCPYDGARTALIEQAMDYCVERCLHCGDIYRFWIPDDECLS